MFTPCPLAATDVRVVKAVSAGTSVLSMSRPASALAHVLVQRQNVAFGAADVPVQVPALTVRVLPTWAVPLTAGRRVAAGGAGLTLALAAELAATVPSALVALTTTRSAWSTSSPVRRYVGAAAAAAAIAAQPVPSAAQRCHR